MKAANVRSTGIAARIAERIGILYAVVPKMKRIPLVYVGGEGSATETESICGLEKVSKLKAFLTPIYSG